MPLLVQHPSLSCFHIRHAVAECRAKHARHITANQTDLKAIIISAGTSVNQLVCWSVSVGRSVGHSLGMVSHIDKIIHSVTPLVGQSVHLNSYLFDTMTKVVPHVLERRSQSSEKLIYLKL